MNYLFKTMHGEYEITEGQREGIFKDLSKYGNRCWVEVPNKVAVHNSNWEIVPIKEKGAPVSESKEIAFPEEGKASNPVLSESVTKRLTAQEACCNTNSKIRWKIGKDGKKRFMMQCSVCGKKGKMVKTTDVENPDEVLEVS